MGGWAGVGTGCGSTISQKRDAIRTKLSLHGACVLETEGDMLYFGFCFRPTKCPELNLSPLSTITHCFCCCLDIYSPTSVPTSDLIGEPSVGIQ